MSNLVICEYGDQLVVDSRLVAEDLGILHKNFMETIQSYQTLIEQKFGVLRFETEKPNNPKGGRPERFVFLNEEQATFLMTLSRNTPQVVECKANLVEAFSKTKKLIPPSTPLEVLQQTVNKMVENERRTRLLEAQQQATTQRVNMIEQRLDGLNSGNTGYQTVRAYCRLHSLNVPNSQAKIIGKIAGRLCRERGISIGTVSDEMYGSVNSYPVEVLEEAIAFLSQPVS